MFAHERQNAEDGRMTYHIYMYIDTRAVFTTSGGSLTLTQLCGEDTITAMILMYMQRKDEEKRQEESRKRQEELRKKEEERQEELRKKEEERQEESRKGLEELRKRWQQQKDADKHFKPTAAPKWQSHRPTSPTSKDRSTSLEATPLSGSSVVGYLSHMAHVKLRAYLRTRTSLTIYVAISCPTPFCPWSWVYLSIWYIMW